MSLSFLLILQPNKLHIEQIFLGGGSETPETVFSSKIEQLTWRSEFLTYTATKNIREIKKANKRIKNLRRVFIYWTPLMMANLQPQRAFFVLRNLTKFTLHAFRILFTMTRSVLLNQTFFKNKWKLWS